MTTFFYHEQPNDPQEKGSDSGDQKAGLHHLIHGSAVVIEGEEEKKEPRQGQHRVARFRFVLSDLISHFGVLRDGLSETKGTKWE